MTRDERFMHVALVLAREAAGQDQLPVGAIIVSADGSIAGSGRKRPESHWRLDHAEMVALREAVPSGAAVQGDERVRGMTVYTTLEPCLMCFGAILNARLDRIVYALEDPYGGGTRLSREHMPPRHREVFPAITAGVLRDEAAAVFREFFRTTKSRFWSNPDNPLVRVCVRP